MNQRIQIIFFVVFFFLASFSEGVPSTLTEDDVSKEITVKNGETLEEITVEDDTLILRDEEQVLQTKTTAKKTAKKTTAKKTTSKKTTAKKTAKKTTAKKTTAKKTAKKTTAKKTTAKKTTAKKTTATKTAKKTTAKKTTATKTAKKTTAKKTTAKKTTAKKTTAKKTTAKKTTAKKTTAKKTTAKKTTAKKTTAKKTTAKKTTSKKKVSPSASLNPDAPKLEVRFDLFVNSATSSRTKLVIKNTGMETAVKVMAKIPIPKNETFVRAKGASADICKAESTYVECTIGDLDRGDVSVMAIKWSGSSTKFTVTVSSSSVATQEVTAEEMF